MISVRDQPVALGCVQGLGFVGFIDEVLYSVRDVYMSVIVVVIVFHSKILSSPMHNKIRASYRRITATRPTSALYVNVKNVKAIIVSKMRVTAGHCTNERRVRKRDKKARRDVI